GALLDLQGNLVGLTSVLAGITGGETPGGFAVPFDARVKRIIDVLKQGEEVEYGFLGVVVNSSSPSAEGVLVEEVTAGSPAHLAGLRKTYILAVAGVAVNDSDDLY